MVLNNLKLNQLFSAIEKRRPTTVYVGYSGGVDSHVLLSLCHAFQKQQNFFTLKALHVNHQLHDQSCAWQAHCQAVCDALSIECLVEAVSIQPAKGQSLEALARDARYACFEKHLIPGDIVLTAHHQDDQAETVLLQLLRGAGPKGLAAMAGEKVFGLGYLQRPLLAYSREDIMSFAREKALRWVEDGSNKNSVFRRNYIRHEVMPTLKKHWPECAKTISRSADLCAQANVVLEENAQQWFEQCAGVSGVLTVSSFLTLDENKQCMVLRHWLQSLSLPAPTQVHLTKIIYEVALAKEDAVPCFTYADVTVRRYADQLYAEKMMCDVEFFDVECWDMQMPLKIANKLLQVKKTKGQGILLPKQATVQVRFRHGGEALYIKGADGKQKLKKLFQQWQVPPWLRDKIPLIYFNDVLVAVVGFASHRDYLVEPEEDGLNFFWM